LKLISACLLGIRCRYDSAEREIPLEIKQLIQKKECLIPVCPEQLAGLSTPRLKSSVSWNALNYRVINENGKDLTEIFTKGAEETLKIALLTGCKKAIFKSRSPSCGEQGVTTALLRNSGIKVVVVDTYHKKQY